jgi:peptide/nickel transport system permease protein
MPRYLAGRLLQALVATFGVMTIVFVVMRLSGDPTLLLVPEGASREHIDALRRELGFDRPILIQYLSYLGDLLRLDLGDSVVQRVPAVDILAARIPYTVALASAALLVALGIGIPVGIAMAVWRGRWFERPLAALVLAGQSLPTFLSGILLIMLFAVSLRWLPSSGADGPAAIIMPAVALGALSMSTFARMARIAIVDELSKDYVRSARARGRTCSARRRGRARGARGRRSGCASTSTPRRRRAAAPGRCGWAPPAARRPSAWQKSSRSASLRF